MKKSIVTLLCIITPLYVNANTFEIDMLHCGLIDDDKTRLQCFDRRLKKQQTDVVASNSTQNNLKTIADDKTEIIEENQSNERKENPLNSDGVEQLGAKHLKSKSGLEKQPQSFVFIVKDVKKNPYGKLRLTFENGQKWKQSDDVNIKIRKGDKVIVKEGFLGAIYMKKQNSNKKFRVKRIK